MTSPNENTSDAQVANVRPVASATRVSGAIHVGEPHSHSLPTAAAAAVEIVMPVSPTLAAPFLSTKKMFFGCMTTNDLCLLRVRAHT